MKIQSGISEVDLNLPGLTGRRSKPRLILRQHSGTFLPTGQPARGAANCQCGNRLRGRRGLEAVGHPAKPRSQPRKAGDFFFDFQLPTFFRERARIERPATIPSASHLHPSPARIRDARCWPLFFYTGGQAPAFSRLVLRFPAARRRARPTGSTGPEVRTRGRLGIAVIEPTGGHAYAGWLRVLHRLCNKSRRAVAPGRSGSTHPGGLG